MKDTYFDKKIKLFKIYTVLFMVMFYFIFFVFDVSGKSFAWGRDSFTVEYPARLILRQLIVDFFKNPSSISMFHFSIGQGLDIASFLNTWYLDPINILMIFCPVSDSEIPFTVICILYLYLSGLSFFLYSTYIYKVRRECVIGSLIYCFSGFALYYAPRHPCFLAPMIYMPCIFLVIEKIIKKSPKYIFSFIFIIFISLTSSYYYFYINTILMLLYIFVRLLVNPNIEYKRKIIDLGVLGAGYILGAGISCAFFLPAMYFYINSNRITGTTIYMKDYLLYEWPYYVKEFIYILIPYINDYRFWLVLGIAPICLIASFNLFLRRHFFETKMLVLTGLIFILFPVFGLCFAAFSSINSRFSYYLVFGFALTFVVMYKFMYQSNKKLQYIVFLYVLLYFIVCFFSKFIEKNKGFVGAALLALTAAAFFEAQNEGINIKIRRIILDMVILITICFGGYSLFSQDFIGYVNEFNNRGEINEKMFLSPLESVSAIDDHSFFRIAEGKTDINNLNSSISAGKYQGVNGISVMHNVIDKNMAKYNILLGNNDYYDRTMIYGLDNRKILETLANVNYYIAPENQLRYIPDIYDFYKTYRNSNVYKRESEYSFNLGYLYSDIIPYSEFEKLEIIERQEVLLQAAVVDDSVKNQYVAYSDYKYWREKVDYTVYNLNGQEIPLDFGYIISVPAETIYIDFYVDEKSDVYVQLSRPSEGSSSYTAILDAVEKNICFMEEGSMYFAGQNTYLVYMGCLEAGDYRMALRCDSFENRPMIATENLQIYTESVNETNTHIRQMIQRPPQNVKVESDHIYAEINAEKDSILFLSIPYTSKGWVAEVDGEQADIICTNIMYMGVPVKAGEHIVELTYTTPYLHIGLIISFGSFLIVVVIYITYKIKYYYRIK